MRNSAAYQNRNSTTILERTTEQGEKWNKQNRRRIRDTGSRLSARKRARKSSLHNSRSQSQSKGLSSNHSNHRNSDRNSHSHKNATLPRVFQSNARSQRALWNSHPDQNHCMHQLVMAKSKCQSPRQWLGQWTAKDSRQIRHGESRTGRKQRLKEEAKQGPKELGWRGMLRYRRPCQCKQSS